MASFSWDQFKEEPAAAAPSPKKGGGGKGKFSWDQFDEEDANPPNEPGLLSKAGNAVLSGVKAVGETVDRFGGAPTRAGIAAAQNVGSMNPIDWLKAGGSAAAGQFGRNPELAPTGKDIVKTAGVPDTALSDVLPGLYSKNGEGRTLKRGGLLDPTASGAAGMAMDIAADPTTLLPIGKIAEGAVGAASRAAKGVGEAVSAAGRVAEKGGTAAVTKIGSMMTGVPEKEIETYISRYPEVQKMIAEHGDDLSGAADKVREGYQASIRGKRAELGGKIGQALEALPTDKAVSINPVIDELEKVKGRMNKSLRFEEVKQVDDLIDRIKSVASSSKVPERELKAAASGPALRIGEGEVGSLTGKGVEYLRDPVTGDVMGEFHNGKLVPIGSGSGKVKLSKDLEEAGTVVTPADIAANPTGKITPKEMYEVKQFLQDRGSGAFMKDGQLFMPGRDAQMAAKNASGVARGIVNTMSPTVADANKDLSRLHVFEQRMNKNLIAPGKSDAALVGAGSGTNSRSVAELQALGQVTGTDLLGDAEKYAAAKRFAHPGLSAVDSTGKAVERMGKAGLIGLGLGGIPGAAIAASITSPLALKAAIQAGRIPVKAIQGLVGGAGHLTDEALSQAYKALKTPEGQKAFEAATQGARVESIGPGGQQGTPKGEDLWAQQGMSNLGLSQDIAQKVLADPKGKQLLIQASDLPPGSKAHKRILDQIQKGWGQ